MKGFASGVGGVCICVLAIMGTVLCGFALGGEEVTNATIKYDQVADTTGLFKTTEAKQFIDYSPAANWTGYTVPGSTGTAGITYETSAKVNSYPINKDQQYLTSKTFNLRNYTLPQADPPGYKGHDGITGLMVYKSQRLDNVTYMTNYILNPRVSTVADFLSVFTPTLSGAYADWSELVIQFQESGSSTINGTCAPVADWYNNWISWTATGNKEKAAFIPYSELMACFYIKIDQTYTVIGYDSGGNELWKCPAAAAGLVYAQVDSSSTYPTTTYAGSVNALGSTLKIGIYGAATTEYMDVSKGVIPSSSTPPTWSNGYQNGKIDILVMWQQTSQAEGLTIEMPITAMTSDGERQKTATLSISRTPGKWIKMDSSSPSSWYGYLGDSWSGILVSINMIEDVLTVYGVDQFRTFQDYSTIPDPILKIESGLTTYLFSGSTIQPSGLSSSSMTITGMTNTPKIGIVDTTVYMGDSSLIMVDPSITPMSLWRNTYNWELRFYSFAVIGDKITVYFDGDTQPVAKYWVEDGKIEIDGTEHMVQDLRIRCVHDVQPEGTTWKIWFIFGGENPSTPIYVGSSAQEDGPTIEMAGYWYFTSAFYAGTRATDTSYVFDFQSFIFDSNAAILCYMGLLILGAIVAKRMAGLGIYDMIVLVFAGVCGFVLMV